LGEEPLPALPKPGLRGPGLEGEELLVPVLVKFADTRGAEGVPSRFKSAGRWWRAVAVAFFFLAETALTPLLESD